MILLTHLELANTVNYDFTNLTALKSRVRALVLLIKIIFNSMYRKKGYLERTTRTRRIVFKFVKT